MATTVTYNKYFSSALAGFNGTTSYSGQINFSLFVDFNAAKADAETRINSMLSASTMQVSGHTTGTLYAHPYSGSLKFAIMAYSGTTYKASSYVTASFDTGGTVTYSWSTTSGDTTASINKILITGVTGSSASFFVASNSTRPVTNRTYKLLASGSTLPLAALGVFNTSISGNLPKIRVTLTIQSASDYSYDTSQKGIYLRKGSSSWGANLEPINIQITPTFLTTDRDTLYGYGRVGSGGSKQLNHQAYMSSNANTAINSVISTWTKSYSFGAGSPNYYPIEIVSASTLTTSGNATSTLTTFSGTSVGTSACYYYRNSTLTVLASGSTFTPSDANNYTGDGKYYLYIWPKKKHETCTHYICVYPYDVAEGYTSPNPLWTLSTRLPVPATDLIKPSASGDAGYTNGTYNITGFTYTDKKSVVHNGVMAILNSSSMPQIGYVSFDDILGMSGSIGIDGVPEGTLTVNWGNKMQYKFNASQEWSQPAYGVSVRYYDSKVNGSDSDIYLPLDYSITDKQYNTSDKYWLAAFPVRKNGPIEGGRTALRNLTGTWSDTIDGITYTSPIEYINKASTLNDLFEKIVCRHGAAMDEWFGEQATLYEILTTYLASTANTRSLYYYLLNNMPSFSASTSTKPKSLVVRSVSVTQRSTITYYEYENNIRFMNYPTFNSYTEPSFTMFSGLCADSGGQVNIIQPASGDIEQEWNNQLDEFSPSTMFNSGTMRTVEYNGLFVTDTAFTRCTIGRSYYKNWDMISLRQTIGQLLPDSGSNYNLTTYINQWITDENDDFDYLNSSDKKNVSPLDSTHQVTNEDLYNS